MDGSEQRVGGGRQVMCRAEVADMNVFFGLVRKNISSEYDLILKSRKSARSRQETERFFGLLTFFRTSPKSRST